MITTNDISTRIKKGVFKPHIYLTNLALSYFQNERGYISGKLFPIVPVSQSTGYYSEFDKGDLARDNVAPKPEFGHVAPAIFGKKDKLYSCSVKQVITGIDLISTLDIQRSNSPATIDPRRAKVRFISEQISIHLDKVWAEKYFNADSWANVYTGSATPSSSNEFYFFDNDNFDPVTFFSELGIKMLLSGLRKPNKMCLGLKAFAALQKNPSILERIKFQGSEANPANVTTNVLSQLFGLSEIVISESIYNDAPYGANDNFKFICNPNDVLLVYATDSPSIEEPSAGYTFAWDMLGNGQYIAIQQAEGHEMTHSEYIEGLVCTSPQITAPDLGVFLKGAVSPDFAV